MSPSPTKVVLLLIIDPPNTVVKLETEHVRALICGGVTLVEEYTLGSM